MTTSELFTFASLLKVVTTVVNNVPVNVPLLPVCLDFAADAVAAAKGIRIATPARRAHQLAGKHTYILSYPV